MIKTGTRLQSQVCDTQVIVVKAAREVFAERGYEATTREIALRAGVSHKLIFRYFDSKENCSSTQS